VGRTSRRTTALNETSLDYYAALSDVVRLLCKERKWTQRTLSQKLWLSSGHLGARLQGAVKWTYAEVLCLADAFGMKPSELMKLVERQASQVVRDSYVFPETM